MSKNEKIREQIGWLKVVFGILSATLISLCGWLATKYNTADDFVTTITVLLIVFISLLIVFINKKAYSKMDELEDI